VLETTNLPGAPGTSLCGRIVAHARLLDRLNRYIARLLAHLEQLLAAWQAGTLPPRQSPAFHETSGPATPRPAPAHARRTRRHRPPIRLANPQPGATQRGTTTHGARPFAAQRPHAPAPNHHDPRPPNTGPDPPARFSPARPRHLATP